MLLEALRQHAAVLDRLAALLDAVCRGTAVARTWQDYQALHLGRAALDEILTALEVRAAALLPLATETRQ